MRLKLAFITFLATLAAIPSAQALERSSDISNDRWVEVSGEGSVGAAPDFARVTLGVTSTGKNAGEAMAANAKAANGLVSLIKAEGVAPADIQTSELSISPMFSQPSPGQQTAPTITGYSVSNNVTVMLRDIPRLGALLDKAVAAGANSIYGVGFGHNDPSALLDKARPIGGRRRQAEGRDLRERGGRENRQADGAYGRGRPPNARRLFPRICCRRSRADADRSGRGQADRDRHRAI